MDAFKERRHPAELCNSSGRNILQCTAQISCSERHPLMPKRGTYTLYIRWGWAKPQRDRKKPTRQNEPKSRHNITTTQTLFPA